MAAIGRTHARLREQLSKHRGEIGRIDQRRTGTACKPPVVEQFGKLATGRTAPRRIARKPFERALERREQRLRSRRRARCKRCEGVAHIGRHLLPPGQKLNGEPMPARLGVRRTLGNPRRYPVPSRLQPRIAQQQIEPSQLIKPQGSAFALAHERVPQQRQQAHRIEVRRKFGEQEQQSARRRPRERLPRAVVDRDAPARQRRRDAFGKRAVGRNERCGAPWRFERRAHQQRNPLRLLPVIGENRAFDPRGRHVQIARALPAVGMGGGREKQGGEFGTLGGSVEVRCGVPRHHLVARDADAVEQQLQMILRVRFDGPRWIVGIGTRRAEAVPFGRVHRDVDSGQHDHAPVEIGNGAQQPRDRGRRGGDPRRDDEPRRRRRAPRHRDAVEQPVASLGPVDGAGLREHGGPMIDEQPQPRERRLPMFGIGAEVQVDERRDRHLFIMELVDDAREPVGKLEGRGARDAILARGRMPLDQFGEHQPPPQRIDRRRDRRGLADRIERERDAFVEVGVADDREPRHQQPVAARADERRLHRAARAIAREQDDTFGEPQRTVGKTSNQPCGKRVGKGPADRDGEDRRLAVRRHSAPPRSARCWPRCRLRTIAPCAKRRTGAPSRSRGSTGCWSKTALRARRPAGAAK